MTSIVYPFGKPKKVHGHLFEEEKSKRVVDIICGPASGSREKESLTYFKYVPICYISL